MLIRRPLWNRLSHDSASDARHVVLQQRLRAAGIGTVGVNQHALSRTGSRRPGTVGRVLQARTDLPCDVRTALQGLPAAGAGTDRSGDPYLPRWLTCGNGSAKSPSLRGLAGCRVRLASDRRGLGGLGNPDRSGGRSPIAVGIRPRGDGPRRRSRSVHERPLVLPEMSRSRSSAANQSGGRAVHTPGHHDRQVQDMLTCARKTWPKFGSLKVSNTWG